MQRALTNPETAGQDAARNDAGTTHVAIIMDGNGRWAARRGRPRSDGHRAGAQAVRRVVEAAPGVGITDLTLYAFSSDNWARPAREVSALLGLLGDYLRREAPRCRAEGVRVSVIGRRDRLPAALRRAIGRAEATTEGGTRLHLRLALDYSARDALVEAAARARAAGRGGADGVLRDERRERREAFARALADGLGARLPVPDVDLLIRTGGEQRLSDFLLWECAYAELYFTACPWPEFGSAALAEAVAEYRRRERRFGRVGPVAVERAG